MPVSQIVTVVGYFSVPAANAAAFRQNCAEMIDLREQEAGHLASAYSFAADGTAVSREDYGSADAVIRHMDVGRHVFESTQALVEITGVELHGPESEIAKLRDLFSAMSPRVYVTEFGFRQPAPNE